MFIGISLRNEIQLELDQEVFEHFDLLFEENEEENILHDDLLTFLI